MGGEGGEGGVLVSRNQGGVGVVGVGLGGGVEGEQALSLVAGLGLDNREVLVDVVLDVGVQDDGDVFGLGKGDNGSEGGDLELHFEVAGEEKSREKTLSVGTPAGLYTNWEFLPKRGKSLP